MTVTVALLAALSAGACEGKGANDGHKDRGGEPSDSPLALAGKTVDGAPFDVATLRGKIVLVNVWATWCAPCRDEMPELVRLANSEAQGDLAVVGVSIDRRPDLLKVRATIQQFRIPYPVVFDPDGAITGAWQLRGYPTSLLLDRHGRIRWRREGVIRPDDSDLAAAIAAARASD